MSAMEQLLTSATEELQDMMQYTKEACVTHKNLPHDKLGRAMLMAAPEGQLGPAMDDAL